MFENLDEAQKKSPKTVDALIISYLLNSGLVPAEAKKLTLKSYNRGVNNNLSVSGSFNLEKRDVTFTFDVSESCDWF